MGIINDIYDDSKANVITECNSETSEKNSLCNKNEVVK
jgi:hypothetical protein